MDTSSVLEMILTYFMIDMWFDPVAREVKIAAISAWQESSGMLKENNQIDFQSVKKDKNESLRSTRALVIYDKRFLATSDSVENYKKASLYRRTELESPDLFGEPKTKRFDFTFLLDKDSADLLVNRWVNRYLNPSTYTWTTQERKLGFNVGQVVDTQTLLDVGFNGSPSSSTRSQIISIKPNYKKEGRDYTIKALSYEPLFTTGSEIIITGLVSDINLYIQYAGAPSQAVELTFVFDGVIGSGTSSVIPAIRAGAFPSGSKIIMILANGADLMSKGGDGGDGGDLFIKASTPDVFSSTPPKNGSNAGVVYDAEGVDTDIYFSGSTPSASFPLADGYIIAPSGGAGGFNADTSASGDGGDGGDGRSSGLAGLFGNASGAAANGAVGSNGVDNKLTGSFGLDGADNEAVGGLKGSGVSDSGGNVVFFGSNASRYINGSGDH
ncbi:MAG TPA: hypothetical protein EYN54_04825 [Methylococcaceae bacterium]|nr:hypothetical protein [Methylococcaceae bacterium]